MTDPSVGGRSLFSPRPERTRRSLPVNQQPSTLSVDVVLLDLRVVVSDVVDRPDIARVEAAAALKRRAHEVRDHLSVGERAVRASRDGREVSRPLRTADRRAGHLPVRDREPVADARRAEFLQVVLPDLVSEGARPRVNGDDDLTFAQSVRGGGLHVEHALDVLHLEVVVARPQRAHLLELTLFGECAHRGGVRPAHPPALLCELEVLG